MNFRPLSRLQASRCVRAACAVAAGMTVSGAVKAQSVTSAAVGAMRYEQAAGSTASLGVPLVRAAVFTGRVEVGGNGFITVTQPAGEPVNLAGLIVGTSPYYIEVTGHSDGVTTGLVGERFEVNETGTSSSANNTLALDGASPLNTAAGADFSSLSGYRITVRPHWTLAALFGTGTGTDLNASTNVNNADQVLAWSGGSFSIYYFRSGTTPHWRNLATGTTSQDQAIIPPGVGIYFRRVTGDYAKTVVGEVRANRFVRPLDNTSQLIANGFPMDFSPGDLLQSTTTGYVASTSSTTADQLLTFVSGSYSIYYYRSGTTPQWRNLATGTTNHSATKLYAATGAVLYRPQGVPADLVQAVPFSLN